MIPAGSAYDPEADRGEYEAMNWTAELECWLGLFLNRLGHKTRRRMCPLCITGLIGPGERKKCSADGGACGSGGYDQLHHFVAAGVWDAAPMVGGKELLIQADRLVGGEGAVLVIDDTGVAEEEGNHSAGVAPAIRLCYWGGGVANCQTLVSVSTGERRGAGDGGATSVPAGELDERCRSYEKSTDDRGIAMVRGDPELDYCVQSQGEQGGDAVDGMICDACENVWTDRPAD